MFTSWFRWIWCQIIQCTLVCWREIITENIPLTKTNEFGVFFSRPEPTVILGRPRSQPRPKDQQKEVTKCFILLVMKTYFGLLCGHWSGCFPFQSFLFFLRTLKNPNMSVWGSGWALVDPFLHQMCGVGRSLWVSWELWHLNYQKNGTPFQTFQKKTTFSWTLALWLRNVKRRTCFSQPKGFLKYSTVWSVNFFLWKLYLNITKKEFSITFR